VSRNFVDQAGVFNIARRNLFLREAALLRKEIERARSEESKLGLLVLAEIYEQMAADCEAPRFPPEVQHG
jgi:hypothetical protein